MRATPLVLTLLTMATLLLPLAAGCDILEPGALLRPTQTLQNCLP